MEEASVFDFWCSNVDTIRYLNWYIAVNLYTMQEILRWLNYQNKLPETNFLDLKLKITAAHLILFTFMISPSTSYSSGSQTDLQRLFPKLLPTPPSTKLQWRKSDNLHDCAESTHPNASQSRHMNTSILPLCNDAHRNRGSDVIDRLLLYVWDLR